MFEEGKKFFDIYGEENVFDFSIGNLSVEFLEIIKVVINDILNEEFLNLVYGYMNNLGYEDVRDVIVEYINKKDGLNFIRENLIMICGVVGGLNIILKIFLNFGDEVIVFVLYFGEYKNYIENYDGKLIEVFINIEIFELDLDVLKNVIILKIRVLIINILNNFIGVIYFEELLKNFGELLDLK